MRRNDTRAFRGRLREFHHGRDSDSRVPAPGDRQADDAPHYGLPLFHAGARREDRGVSHVGKGARAVLQAVRLPRPSQRDAWRRNEPVAGKVNNAHFVICEK